MADDEARTGGFWDWPVGVIVAGLLVALLSAVNGGTGGATLGLLVAVFGVVALLIRRGAFTPRGR